MRDQIKHDLRIIVDVDAGGRPVDDVTEAITDALVAGDLDRFQLRTEPLGINRILAEATALPEDLPSEPAARRWSDADRELVARAMFEEAHEGDHDAFRWEDLKPHYEEQAEAALDALAADGRLADPQEATSVDCTVTREGCAEDGGGDAGALACGA